MVRYLSAFTVLFVLALAAPAFASNADAISGTPSVTAVLSHGNLVVTFKHKHGRTLFRKIAGREINLSCGMAHSDPTSPFENYATDDFTAPKHGRRLRSKLRGDFCEVLLVHKRSEVTPIVAVAVTPAGQAFLDERLQAFLVDSVMTMASFDAENGHYPTADQIVSKWHGAVVALASPADNPPPGKYGFYSDGAQHIAAVAIARSGKRLFEEANGDTVSTNVFGYLDSLQFDTLTSG